MAVSNDKSEEWKKRAKENQDKAFEMIHNVESMYMSDVNKMIEFLKTASQFYQYSINNLKLIYAQNPDATYVQSFEAWKKAGYPVQKGQKGMKILVPVRVTLLKMADGEFVSLSDATPEQKKMYENGDIEGYKKTNYKIGNVFDIKQTNFPLEGYDELLGSVKDVSFSENLELLKTISKEILLERDSTLESVFISIMIQHFLEEEISSESRAVLAEKINNYSSELKNVNPLLKDEDITKFIDESLDSAIKQFRLALEPELEEKTPVKHMNASASESPSPVLKKKSMAEENYISMLELAPGVLKGDVEYIRFDDGEGFDKLTVEKIGSNRIVMSHTFIQNGNVMADPDMEFEIDHDNQTLNARSFQNDPMQYYTCVENEHGNINRTLEKELNEFACTWFKNIKCQGYKMIQDNDNELDDSEQMQEEQRDLEVGDIIEYEGKRWRITQNDDNFMVSGENLDPNDIERSFQWIGSVNQHEYKIVNDEVKKTIVALESTEDYSDHPNGFYTYSYQDGRSGIRYRLVTVGEDGLLKTYLSEKQFFINRELAEEYIEKHTAELEVISYDDIVHKAAAERIRIELEQQVSENTADISYYFEVVECSEFRSMGQVYSNIVSTEAAIEQYMTIEEEKRTLVPGINLIVTLPEENQEIPLSSGRNIDLDMFKYYPGIENNEKIKSVVHDFVKEAKKSGFHTYGTYSFNDEKQQNVNIRRRRGR